jgi:hypothetical protein
MSFKIDFGKDWDTLRKTLNIDENLQRAIPDISVSILKLHNTLERRVDEQFNAPTKLSSVMIGSSVKPEALGKTFLRYNLQYRDKSIPLAQYGHTETKIPSPNAKVPIRISDRFIRWKPKGYAIQTEVSVRKGKPQIPRRVGGVNAKGFLQYGRILARKQKATWINVQDNIRAPYSELYGPSLMTLANKVYDTDKQVANAVDNLQIDIIEALIRNINA